MGPVTTFLRRDGTHQGGGADGGGGAGAIRLGRLRGRRLAWRRGLRLAAPQVAGGLHHRFGIGDSFIVIVDEWKSVDHFQKFFGDPDLQAFIGSVGGAPLLRQSSSSAKRSLHPDQF